MIGIDAVDVERLRGVMSRRAGTEGRLFTETERTYCHSRVDPVLHFAGTLAVKEAVIKAARLGPLLAWSHRIEVSRDRSGVPRVQVDGQPQRRFDISISHDGPVAVAVAVAHGPIAEETSPVRGPGAAGSGLRPNARLQRYIGGGHRDDASVSVFGTDFP